MIKDKKLVTKWLDSINYDSEPINYELYDNKLSNYYSEKSLKKNNNSRINELLELKQLIKNGKICNLERNKGYDRQLIEDSHFVQVFEKEGKNFYFYINQYTNRYLVNMLFNQLIDECIKNNLIDENGKYIINKDMRQKFIEFCYNNSQHLYDNYPN